MAHKIGIIGKGNVGQALADGLRKGGHEIRFGTRDPSEPMKAAAEWADMVIIAVPWHALSEVVAALGDSLDGKTVVDVTNVIGPSMDLAIGHTTSGAEELQKQLPRAKVVKAFNTVFAHLMRTGQVHGERITAFVAGDDAASKEIVRRLAEDIGFEGVDAGPLQSARYLEPMGMLMIALAYRLGMGSNMGLRLVRGG